MTDEEEVLREPSQSSEIKELAPIPSMKALFLIVPIFCFVLALQGIDLKQRATTKEVSIRNEGVISQVAQAKDDFEKQAVGWASLMDSHQSRLGELQSSLVRGDAQLQALNEKKKSDFAECAKIEEQLSSLKAELAAAQSKLTKANVELDTVTVRKTELDTSFRKTGVELEKLNVSQTSLQEVVDRLGKERASLQEMLKAQTEKISGNKGVIQDLDLKKSELVTISQEIKVNENISTAIKKEVLRLETRRDELDQEIKKKESANKSLAVPNPANKNETKEVSQ